MERKEQERERERERESSGRTWKGNGRDDRWRGRGRDINTPSGPNGQISAAVPHLIRSTTALKVWHCRTCQDSKGQDLNSRLSWLWLEDIWCVNEHLVAHQSLCVVSPFIVRLFLISSSKYKRI
jgi:hypothetical protein